MTADKKKSVTVLFSGRGSNMETLIKASHQEGYPAEITKAITNNPNAGGIAVAKEYGIDVVVVDHKKFDTRQAHEDALAIEVATPEPDIIVLAGYMRIFTDDFVKKFPKKMINIHPSLLPKYKGINTHQRAIDAGEIKHGCTVHFVEEELDGGPIIAQAEVAIQTDDTAETLSARVLVQEHILYPKALALVANNIGNAQL